MQGDIIMRDPKRIERIGRKFIDLWKIYPNMRFFQFVEYLKSQNTKDDSFYIEDEETEKIIDNLLNKPSL